MRTVAATLFASVDGVVEDPHLWQHDSFDAELGEAMGAGIAPIDDAILGRRLYEQWSAHWSNAGADDPFAAFINPVRKHVASRTLTGSLDWQHSTLIAGDLLEFVADLKAQDGGTIGVMGSLSVVRQLVVAGLLDELTLIVHPVLVGRGRRLFDEDTPETRLRLLSSSTTSAGNVIATYGPFGR